MIRNQKGFAFPLSYSIFILTCLFVVMNIEFFIAEKRLLNETETILKQEYYMLSAVKELEGRLQQNESVDLTGTFQFNDGKVDYKLEELTGSLMQITFSLQLNTNEEGLGYGFYDKNVQKMIKWVEKN